MPPLFSACSHGMVRNYGQRLFNLYLLIRVNERWLGIRVRQKLYSPYSRSKTAPVHATEFLRAVHLTATYRKSNNKHRPLHYTRVLISP